MREDLYYGYDDDTDGADDGHDDTRIRSGSGILRGLGGDNGDYHLHDRRCGGLYGYRLEDGLERAVCLHRLPCHDINRALIIIVPAQCQPQDMIPRRHIIHGSRCSSDIDSIDQNTGTGRGGKNAHIAGGSGCRCGRHRCCGRCDC